MLRILAVAGGSVNPKLMLDHLRYSMGGLWARFKYTCCKESGAGPSDEGKPGLNTWIKETSGPRTFPQSWLGPTESWR